MNEVAWGLLVVLLRTTAFFGGAALAARLVLKLGRPASPTVHRAVWLLVLLTGWFWWRLPVTIPYRETAVVRQMPSAAQGGAEQLAGQPSVSLDQDLRNRPITSAIAPHVRQQSANQGSLAVVRANWSVAILGVWLSGMFAILMVWIVRYAGSLRRLRAAGPAEEAWVRQWDDLCVLHGIREAIPLRATQRLGPLLCRAPGGYLLVVPAVLWRQLTPTERLSILQHELAHWKRRDPMKSTMVRLLALPHWFNPLSWLVAGWFDEAAEWACDEVAKGPSVEGCQEYAKALLQLDAVLGPRLSYHAAASGRGLSVRVQRLLRPQNEKDSLMKKTTILGTALGLALLGLVRLELIAKEPVDNGPVKGAIRKPLVIDFVAELGDKLTEGQRLYCEWDAATFGLPDPTQWKNLSAQEKAAKEKELLKQLSNDEESERVKAIDGLVALSSKKAVPGILRIAADRKEKNNWDRHTATRALGMLGDPSVVPELVHLTYHYNWNVRQWAQIALVRFTGQNFGHDVAAWRQWWKQHGGKPPIDVQPVKWATSPWMLNALGKLGNPSGQDEMDRQWIARRKESLGLQSPRDGKLSAIQRAMRDASEQNLSQSLSPSRWQNLDSQERAAEESQWLKQLSDPSESARVMAIYALTVLKSKKAVPGLLQIATERKEKNNRDRWMACRALGVVGDMSVTPELVQLTYHYNRDTRLWAQISLVRLTGENFGRDVAAWRQWWDNRGGKPPISEQPVKWATTPEMLRYADPKTMDESDRQLTGGDARARQINHGRAGTYWEKYKLWASYHKGMGGVAKNPAEANKLLAELVKGAYVVTFRPVHDFAPKTPSEFLAKFLNEPVLRSTSTGLGGASFFRTKPKNGVLIGSFLTEIPDETRKALESTRSVKVISVEKLTPERFIRYDASTQESLE
jgi:beta-lactamase regulating signal transducer with metallopeptidase domain/HEAT repeat protein